MGQTIPFPDPPAVRAKESHIQARPSEYFTHSVVVDCSLCQWPHTRGNANKGKLALSLHTGPCTSCSVDACLHRSAQVGDVSRRKELWVQPACDGEMSLSWVIWWGLTPGRRSQRDGHGKARGEAGGLERGRGARIVQGIPNVLTRERRDWRHTVTAGVEGTHGSRGRVSVCSKGCPQYQSP